MQCVQGTRGVFSRICCIIMACIFMTGHCFAQSDSSQDRAYYLYTQGEGATIVDKRQKNFNDALALYLDILNQNESGPLYYNIGNCYYQLREYGLAVYYYYKAKALIPRNDMVETNLRVALSKIGIQQEASSWFNSSLAFFYYKLSAYEKSMWAIGFFVCAFLLSSLYIWLSTKAFLQIAKVSFTLGIVLYCLLVWQTYFIPPQGVVIRTSSLYRGPGLEYVVLPQPCLAGVKATVIQVDGEGNWLKIRAPGIQEGYISKENIRLL